MDSAYYIDPHSDGADLDELMKAEVAPSDIVLEKYTWPNAARELTKVIKQFTAMSF